AAQRARRLPLVDQTRRTQVGQLISRWIEQWERSDLRKAALALPSLPVLLADESLPSLTDRIARAPSLIAWAAATGLVGWLAERRAELPNDASTTLFEATGERIRREQAVDSVSPPDRDNPDLFAALVLLLGHVATSKHVASAASIVASAFLAPR